MNIFLTISRKNDNIHDENVKNRSIKVTYQSYEANNSEIDSKFDELVLVEGK